MKDIVAVIAGTLMVIFAITMGIMLTIGAWLTHIFYCFVTGQYGFLIAGAIFAPIGWMHGLYICFITILGG